MSNPADFTGSVPTYYDRYLGPVLFEPYAVDLARRLTPAPGLRVLELACGTGIATSRLRAALPPSATLVATDLNAAMVAGRVSGRQRRTLRTASSVAHRSVTS